MNVFISQPMAGKSTDEIKQERERIKRQLKLIYTEPCNIVDSFMEGKVDGKTPLWCLGESIKYLSEADLAVFSKGWEKSRGSSRWTSYPSTPRIIWRC